MLAMFSLHIHEMIFQARYITGYWSQDYFEIRLLQKPMSVQGARYKSATVN